MRFKRNLLSYLITIESIRFTLSIFVFKLRWWKAGSCLEQWAATAHGYTLWCKAVRWWRTPGAMWCRCWLVGWLVAVCTDARLCEISGLAITWPRPPARWRNRRTTYVAKWKESERKNREVFFVSSYTPFPPNLLPFTLNSSYYICMLNADPGD